jgi:hypothetical protein
MAETSDPKSVVDPIQRIENLFFAIQRNLTNEAKNIIWQCLDTAKKYYPKTLYGEDWTRMLDALEDVIKDFENELSGQAELKLYALQKNLEELKEKETNT